MVWQSKKRLAKKCMCHLVVLCSLDILVRVCECDSWARLLKVKAMYYAMACLPCPWTSRKCNSAFAELSLYLICTLSITKRISLQSFILYMYRLSKLLAKCVIDQIREISQEDGKKISSTANKNFNKSKIILLFRIVHCIPITRSENIHNLSHTYWFIHPSYCGIYSSSQPSIHPSIHNHGW